MFNKAAAILALLLFPPALRAADYYVSATGNDANPGTSIAQAWATTTKVNSTTFAAGDHIYFEGGSTFAGGLSFSATDAGTPANPILLTSYGTGRATISSAAARGLFLSNTQGFEASNLIFVGSGPTVSATNGVQASNSTGVRKSHLYFDNLDVSGYGSASAGSGANGTGIAITSSTAQGYSDVRVTNCVVHDNQICGICTSGPWLSKATHQNFYVANTVIHSNFGDPGYTGSHSGSGLILAEVTGATVEYCESYANGQYCNHPGGGPVGLWSWDSDSIVIQYSESHHNRTGTSSGDGGGFDIDGGDTNCVLQYNYSHDNDGAGYLVAQFSAGGTYSNNTIRYNVSEDDGRQHGYAGITWWVAGGETITNVNAYNNTIYMSPAASGSPSAVSKIWDTGGYSNCHIANNILVTTGGLNIVDWQQSGAGISFSGNDYYSYASGTTFNFYWVSSQSNNRTLAQFRTTTGKETGTGFSVNPLLTSPGTGGTISPAALNTLSAYLLTSGSPLIDTGLTLTAAPYSLSVGSQDFYGNAIPANTYYDVGAHEWTGGAATATPSLTPTFSWTQTWTPTWTKTWTATWTQTATMTASPTLTGTPTASLTSSGTASVTLTWTVSPVFTATASPSITATSTVSPTPTASSTSTSSSSPTFTSTPTWTASPAFTDTVSPTITSTFSATPSASATRSPTSSSTASPTITATPSQTATFSPGPSATVTSTWTETALVPAPLEGESYIYPSPVRGNLAHVVLNLSEAGTARVMLYNERADLVQTEARSGGSGALHIPINVAPYAPGVYLYRIRIEYASGKKAETQLRKFAVIH